jgi:hypothetical protein
MGISQERAEPRRRTRAGEVHEEKCMRGGVDLITTKKRVDVT